MKQVHCIYRGLVGLTVGAGMPVIYGAAVPAARATERPEPPGWNKHPPLPLTHHPHAHAVVTGGMAGWQVALIVVAAALLAEALLLLLDRLRVRRRVTATAGLAMTAVGAPSRGPWSAATATEETVMQPSIPGSHTSAQVPDRAAPPAAAR